MSWWMSWRRQKTMDGRLTQSGRTQGKDGWKPANMLVRLGRA